MHNYVCIGKNLSDLRQKGRWCFPSTPVSSTKKTDRLDIAEYTVECGIKHHYPILAFGRDKYFYCYFYYMSLVWVKIHRISRVNDKYLITSIAWYGEMCKAYEGDIGPEILSFKKRLN